LRPDNIIFFAPLAAGYFAKSPFLFRHHFPLKSFNYLFSASSFLTILPLTAPNRHKSGLRR